MIWKPKEKELSLDQAIVLAKRELAPYWLGSEPLIAAFEKDSQLMAVPLSEKIQKKSWMLFLVDPTDFGTELALSQAKRWVQRYGSPQFAFLLVVVPSYEFQKNPDTLPALLDRLQAGFPAVLDHSRSLSEAFQVSEFPSVVLLEKGQKVSQSLARGDLSELELELQNHLRKSDPGLALPPLSAPLSGVLRDSGRWELGFSPSFGSGAEFPDPGFEDQANGTRRGTFTFAQSHANSSFWIEGSWTQTPQGIRTQDPHARIQFISPGSQVALIAASEASNSSPMIRIAVEVHGVSSFDAVAGEDLKMDDSGEFHLRITKPMKYHMLRHLRPGRRKVTLHFSQLQGQAVTLYGLRFAEG
ncbi:MAG: hypothetical protein ACO3A2_02055 [Bdellovibrionia bacterium]